VTIINIIVSCAVTVNVPEFPMANLNDGIIEICGVLFERGYLP